MSDLTANDFVYVTYIRTTPERLWRALTEPAHTEQYWGARFDTDWKVGSEAIWNEGPEGVGSGGMRIVESDPFRRLSFTWHDFSQEWGDVHGIGSDVVDALSNEPKTTATYEIEDVSEGGNEKVRLTLVHTGFIDGSVMRGMISNGWPAIFANLKTYLETGELLPDGQPKAER